MNSFIRFFNIHIDRYFKNFIYPNHFYADSLLLTKMFSDVSSVKDFFLDSKKVLESKKKLYKFNAGFNRSQYGLNFIKIVPNFYNVKFLRVNFRKFKITRKNFSKLYNLRKFLVYPASFSYGSFFNQKHDTLNQLFFLSQVLNLKHFKAFQKIHKKYPFRSLVTKRSYIPSKTFRRRLN